MCRKIDLGVAAQWWFEHWMDAKLLPSLVLERLRFADGVFSTWLPEDMPEAEAQTFESGGKFHWTPDGCWPPRCLSEVISESLGIRPDCVWIFEDPLSHPSDPWLAHTSIENICCSTEHVYLVLNSGAPRDLIQKTADACIAALPPMIGVYSVGVGPLVETRITEETLHGLAETVDALVAGAYDGEGFIAWRRNRLVRSNCEPGR